METSVLDKIEAEIIGIFEDCRKQGLSKREIALIFAPLGITQDDLPKEKKKARKSLLTSIPRIKSEMVLTLGLIILLGASILLVTPYMNMKNLRFHGLAIFRIGLLKILPFWSWTELYHSRCLIRNPFFELPDLNQDDCNLCETMENIDRLGNISQNEIIEEYIRRERPFIATDAMDSWEIMKTNQLWFDNITELYLSQGPLRVCNLNTNLRISPYGDITKLLKKLYKPQTVQWFIHWENCQKESAKATRQFFRRPYFISNSLDFTGSNWILMSSDYRGRVYKKIEVADSLSLLYQIRGFNHFRLSPRETCRGSCPELIDTLNEGEILIVTNLLWVLEYIPGESSDNLAIISEVSWPSLD